MLKYSEKDRGKKIAFKLKYGRKPNKQEIKMLKKNHIIEKSEMEDSVSSRYSANSVNTGKADMFKMMG